MAMSAECQGLYHSILTVPGASPTTPTTTGNGTRKTKSRRASADQSSAPVLAPEAAPKFAVSPPPLKRKNSSGQKRSNDRSYRCAFPGCDASFMTSWNLTRHKTVHTGVKDFGCTFPGCTKKFSTKEKLKRHDRSHTGLKPYECPVCPKHFSTSGNLKRHTLTHGKPASAPFRRSHSTAVSKLDFRQYQKRHLQEDELFESLSSSVLPFRMLESMPGPSHRRPRATREGFLTSQACHFRPYARRFSHNEAVKAASEPPLEVSSRGSAFFMYWYS